MPVRKNAKFLTAAEREAFVKACVLMKADIVNPGAAAAQQYSRWDENVAIHNMIQNAFAPGSTFVNFGHGGAGAYAFFSWHRFFLVRFEAQLQGYVPGVMVPYWDWTDPTSIMTDTFLGPNGSGGSNAVSSGYFASSAPGTGSNPTPAPAWWPAGLTGWVLPTAFGAGAGSLRRHLSAVSQLPSATDLRQALSATTYAAFQNAVESGAGLTSGNQMHNGMHGWLGGPNGQMSYPAFSPFDPFFYLHHCNIDRLWAMWQADGHADEYPVSGGKPQHNRNDLMYPWVGSTPGYGTNSSLASAIPMPNVSAVGPKTNAGTLDLRGAFDYTYDVIPVIGIGLDRTGSMLGMTPDPMSTSAPPITKWEAARRGVSALLADCETVQQSGVSYVIAGVKTFRRLGTGNDFTAVFGTPGYGLVKAGGAISRAGFDGAAATLTPGGDTPLADALLDVHDALTEPPFSALPSDQRRYLAMLTDGILTAGAPMSSIADHSLNRTAVFGMGFGTGADVDYATIAALVGKGETLSTQQVFHGENAGTIDKFYTNALAAAIGFTAVIDPVLELFGGEHAHVDFWATSAEDAFLITVQGMDFDDANWSYALHGPDGSMIYGDASGMHAMGMDCHTCLVDVTATRADGRLTLVMQRDRADTDCWVGAWRLMVAYRASHFDAMVMPLISELMLPVAGWPSRGPRFARSTPQAATQVLPRSLQVRPANRLDTVPLGTNRNDNPGETVIVSIYARTRLRLELLPDAELAKRGDEVTFRLQTTALTGTFIVDQSLARMISPALDVRRPFAELAAKPPRSAMVPGTKDRIDVALALARLEQENPKVGAVRDVELSVVSHDSGALHAHAERTDVPGAYHVGLYISGAYCADHSHAEAGQAGGAHDHDHEPPAAGPAVGPLPPGCDADCTLESFTRILNSSAAVLDARRWREVNAPAPMDATR
jgi:Common central domain of tyrosinase